MWKRRPNDGLFCWPRYFDGRDACLRSRSRRRGGSREQDRKVDRRGDRRRVGEKHANLSSHRVRDTGRMAPILVSRVEPAWSPSGLCREPAKGLPGSSSRSPPTRPIAMMRSWSGGTSPELASSSLVHVKSLRAHALRSLISARKKLVGQRVTLENQIRGLAVVFGVRLPRALTTAFIDQALKASEGVAGLSAAMRGLSAARVAVMTAVAAIDADIRRMMRRASAACRRHHDYPRRRTVDRLSPLSRQSDDPSRIRRSRDIGCASSGLGPQAVSVGGGRLHRRHLLNAAMGGCEPCCTRPPTSC